MKIKNIKGIRREQLFFEDVKVGNEITPLTKPPFKQANQAAFGAVFGTWCPDHFDYHFAKEFWNVSVPIAYGAQTEPFLCQLMTDWIGPNGTLKKLAGQVRNPLFLGMSLTMKGEIVKKYVKDGENYVECEIRAEDQDGEVIVTGSATVTLPSKSL